MDKKIQEIEINTEVGKLINEGVLFDGVTISLKPTNQAEILTLATLSLFGKYPASPIIKTNNGEDYVITEDKIGELLSQMHLKIEDARQVGRKMKKELINN